MLVGQLGCVCAANTKSCAPSPCQSSCHQCPNRVRRRFRAFYWLWWLQLRCSCWSLGCVQCSSAVHWVVLVLRHSSQCSALKVFLTDQFPQTSTCKASPPLCAKSAQQISFNQQCPQQRGCGSHHGALSPLWVASTQHYNTSKYHQNTWATHGDQTILGCLESSSFKGKVIIIKQHSAWTQCSLSHPLSFIPCRYGQWPRSREMNGFQLSKLRHTLLLMNQ